MIVQRWKEYTTESAEKLANQRKIKLYPDRSTTSSSGTVWRHGHRGNLPPVPEQQPGNLKWQIYKALQSGRV